MTAPAWAPPALPVAAGVEAEGTWRSPGYRSSARRGRAVVVLLGAVVVVCAAGTAMDIRGLGLVAEAEAGTITAAGAEAFDGLNTTIAQLQGALFLASVVGVLAWLSRVVDNIPPLTGHTPLRGPRAAMGWWFVPFASWVVPYQIVSDAVARLRTREVEGGRWLLRAWWGFWLVGNVLGQLLWRLPSDTLDELRTLFGLTALSDAAEGVAGILLILLVRQVEGWSAERAQRLGLHLAPQPAWPPFARMAPEPSAGAPSAWGAEQAGGPDGQQTGGPEGEPAPTTAAEDSAASAPGWR